jgi:hypothetical protein
MLSLLTVMGGLIAAAVFKKGKDPVSTQAKTLWELGATDING